jgi:seryl-tRNA synthetase
MADLETQEAYKKFLDELVKAGLLIPSGVRGVYGRGGAFENIVDLFEDLVTRTGAHLKAEVMRFPPILNRETYTCTDHIHNFPDLLGSVHSFKGGEREQAAMIAKLDDPHSEKDAWTEDLSTTDVMMVPAACYPLYPAATGILPPGGRTVDLKTFVFRHEPSDDPARMQIFRQREFVRLGTPEEAIASRDFWLKTGSELLKSLGLNASIVVANDPFFGRGGRLRKATQREQDLKHEIVVPICSEKEPTAVSSCNYHLDSFGSKFKIKSSDGETAHTSCIGFGLERITLALFKTHGLDVNKWPKEVRALLRLDGSHTRTGLV